MILNQQRAENEGIAAGMILREAVRHWGEELQVIKALEELGELQTALARLFICHTGGKGNKAALVANVCEELADAEIMLAQLGMMFPDNYDTYAYKLRRLAGMLDIEDVALPGGGADGA